MEKQQAKKLAKLDIDHKEKHKAVQKDYAGKIQLEQTRFSELGKKLEKLKIKSLMNILRP